MKCLIRCFIGTFQTIAAELQMVWKSHKSHWFIKVLWTPVVAVLPQTGSYRFRTMSPAPRGSMSCSLEHSVPQRMETKPNNDKGTYHLFYFCLIFYHPSRFLFAYTPSGAYFHPWHFLWKPGLGHLVISQDSIHYHISLTFLFVCDKCRLN